MGNLCCSSPVAFCVLCTVLCSNFIDFRLFTFLFSFLSSLPSLFCSPFSFPPFFPCVVLINATVEESEEGGKLWPGVHAGQGGDDARWQGHHWQHLRGVLPRVLVRQPALPPRFGREAAARWRWRAGRAKENQWSLFDWSFLRSNIQNLEYLGDCWLGATPMLM